MLSAKQTETIAAAIAAFKREHPGEPRPGPCFFSDRLVRERAYPFIWQSRDGECVAVCPDHHEAHYCSSVCRRLEPNLEEMGTHICEITLMERPARRDTQPAPATESLIDLYRSIHCITHPLVVRKDLCSANCPRWYSFPETSRYMCMQHNVGHDCGTDHCTVVGGRCVISGIESDEADTTLRADDDESAPGPSVAHAPGVAARTGYRARRYTRRVGNTVTARAAIALIATRVFSHTLECQERVDQWCEFIFEFLSIIECITASPLEPYVAAIFQQCQQDGLVIRSVRCLPEKMLQEVTNIRAATAGSGETSKAAASIMLSAVRHLPAIAQLYAKYFVS